MPPMTASSAQMRVCRSNQSFIDCPPASRRIPYEYRLLDARLLTSSNFGLHLLSPQVGAVPCPKTKPLLDYGAVVNVLDESVWLPPASIASTSHSYSVSGSRNSRDTVRLVTSAGTSTLNPRLPATRLGSSVVAITWYPMISMSVEPSKVSVTGSHMMTRLLGSTTSPSAGEMRKGPAGIVWVNITSPSSRVPSIPTPSNSYSPSGNRARNTTSGTSASDGSELSKNVSVRPCFAKLFVPVISRNLRPSGLKPSRRL